jgi:hypothetical protein
MDPKMMREWLAAQSQKRQLTEADLQRKRLGVVQQAEEKTKKGHPATHAGNPNLQEQLNAEEEAYAKAHKHMLSNMVEQYGKEKGTKVFYATVRNNVRGK